MENVPAESKFQANAMFLVAESWGIMQYMHVWSWIIQAYIKGKVSRTKGSGNICPKWENGAINAPFCLHCPAVRHMCDIVCCGMETNEELPTGYGAEQGTCNDELK